MYVSVKTRRTLHQKRADSAVQKLLSLNGNDGRGEKRTNETYVPLKGTQEMCPKTGEGNELGADCM